jgi:hypothetical protein
MLVAFAVCCIIFPLMGGMLIAVLDNIFRGATEDFFQYVVPCFVIPAHFFICFVLQTMILRRVQELASK